MSEYPFTAELSATGFSREIQLIAIFDHYPAEKGSFEEGMQMEPDIEEYIEIVEITANNKFRPIDLAVALALDGHEDLSQLEDEILNSRD